MHRRIPLLLILGFTGFLWLVAFQTLVPVLPKGTPLRGATNPPAKPEWTWQAFKTGETFRAVDNWFNAHVGFRNYWVRLDNQISYTFFGEMVRHPEGTHVVAGEGDWLYEHHYISNAVKPGTMTEAEMREGIARIRRVQDKLAARGLPFLLVVAPSKVEIYPEHVPAVYWGGRDPAKVQTNFERSRALFAEYGINLYDGPARFREWKRTMPDNLFSRAGTHWSYFAAHRVLEDIRERLNPRLRHPLPEFKLRALRSHEPLGNDEDLLALLNLLAESPYRHDVPYPEIEPRTDIPPANLPRILWVHDSFGWALIDLLYPAKAAKPSESLYYFENAYAIPGQKNLNRDLKHLDWETYLRDYDGVVMVFTEIAFDFMGWGFFQALDEHLP